ncbi:lysophospholipid acyltransferase [Thiopseudomonas denitrificans]|uniref:KDO2-lipid IV(A) lauroyltransferase n=1 Tax=Thiopseudomonas denitrificans TaxID=1501432 RepID=A0A4R6U0H9_9GAMM|nr:lysophospholipid acyltransferase [Thiopseudomonas denitrificans]TDQ37785.1 KDO2-lipid IV(A) lauroyltransferase [Thiopseudomonas denitrificans]
MEKLKGLLAVGALRLIAMLPWSAVQKLGRLAGWLMYKFPNRSTQVARINLKHCFPDLATTELERLLQENLKNIGQSFTESACAWVWPPRKTLQRIREVEGLEILQKARTEGKAIVGITSHLGNWEVLNHFYCLHGGNPVIFYRPPKLKAVDELLARQRAQMGNRVAPSTREGIISVIKEVRKGGAVGIPADPEPSLNSGVFVPFLAVQALTSKFVAGMLAGQQDKVAGVFLHAVRLPDHRGFKVIIEAAPDDMYSSDTATAVAAMSTTLASYVARWPEQYMWTMKRFRRRPAGEARWY